MLTKNNTESCHSRGVTTGSISSFKFVVDVEMCSFRPLTLMELILIPDNSLLYLHSNDMNSVKSLFLKRKSYSYKYNCYKNPHLKSDCNRLVTKPYYRLEMLSE